MHVRYLHCLLTSIHIAIHPQLSELGPEFFTRPRSSMFLLPHLAQKTFSVILLPISRSIKKSLLQQTNVLPRDAFNYCLMMLHHCQKLFNLSIVIFFMCVCPCISLIYKLFSFFARLSLHSSVAYFFNFSSLCFFFVFFFLLQ